MEREVLKILWAGVPRSLCSLVRKPFVNVQSECGSLFSINEDEALPAAIRCPKCVR